jgi:hypothetical protein
MKYLSWTLTNPAIVKNPKDSRVYAMNNKGEKFTAVSVDAAMREIMIREYLVSDFRGDQEQSPSENET